MTMTTAMTADGIRATGQVILQDDSYFLGQLFTFSPSRVLHRTVAMPCDRE
jgi:hypothetical protein